MEGWITPTFEQDELCFGDHKKIDIDDKISSLLGHILLPKEDILSIGERDRSSAGDALSWSEKANYIPL